MIVCKGCLYKVHVVSSEHIDAAAVSNMSDVEYVPVSSGPSLRPMVQCCISGQLVV